MTAQGNRNRHIINWINNINKNVRKMLNAAILDGNSQRKLTIFFFTSTSASVLGMAVKIRDVLTHGFYHFTSFLTWLSEDIWVSYSHSSCEVVPSVLRFKLPRDKLRLLSLKRQIKIKTYTGLQRTALIFHDLDRDSVWIWITKMDSRTGKGKRIWPETPFWLVHARWDAAEHERSGYLRSPSHQSVLGHPKMWI